MKKKILVPVICIVSAAIVFFIIQIYWYYNPEIEISNGISETKTKEMIMVSFKEKSIFGMSNSKKQQINEFCEKNDAIIQDYHKIDGVYYVDANVVIENKGMKIVYDVESYTNGKQENSHFETTTPFILTNKINFDNALISADEAWEVYLGE